MSVRRDQLLRTFWFLYDLACLAYRGEMDVGVEPDLLFGEPRAHPIVNFGCQTLQSGIESYSSLLRTKDCNHIFRTMAKAELNAIKARVRLDDDDEDAVRIAECIAAAEQDLNYDSMMRLWSAVGPAMNSEIMALPLWKEWEL